MSFPQANYYARFAGEVFPFYGYLNDLAKMTALTESKKFRSICKAVLHIRPLAVELQLSEPLTDITIESFIALMAYILFVQQGMWQVYDGEVRGMPRDDYLAIEPTGKAKTLWEWFWSLVVGICEKVHEIVKDKNPRTMADC